LGGAALTFNGTTTWANVGTDVTAFQPAKVTVAAWVRRSSKATESVVFGSEFGTSGVLLEHDGTTNALIRINGGGAGTASTALSNIPVGVWCRLVGTYDLTNVILYLNGVAVATTGYSTAISYSSMSGKTVGIGQYAGGLASFWGGDLKDVCLANRAWTPGEVAADYAPATRWALYDRPRGRLWVSSASGPLFDAASNSGYQAAASTVSWSHTCTGTNRFLAVDVSRLGTPGTTVTGITYNGVALSQIGAKSSATDALKVDCWGLANPASGSNTIAVTLSGAAAFAGTAVSYTNVDQTTPTEAFNSATATNVGVADATVTVTTVAANDWVHAALATDDAAVTANQTTRNNVTGAGGSGADEDTGPVVTPAATAMSYTNVGNAQTWVIAGYGIRPFGSAQPATYLPQDLKHQPGFQPVMAM
jgi:hypothetical protein